MPRFFSGNKSVRDELGALRSKTKARLCYPSESVAKFLQAELVKQNKKELKQDINARRHIAVSNPKHHHDRILIASGQDHSKEFHESSQIPIAERHSSDSPLQRTGSCLG